MPHAAIEFHEVCLPTDEEEALRVLKPYAERFRLHPLTVEDCTHRNQRSKIETFEEYLFIVWHLYTSQREEFHEVHLCVWPGAVLVVSEGRPPKGDTWREYLLRGRTAEGNLKQLVTGILDRLVDDAEEHLEVLQEGAAELEQEILERPMAPEDVLYLKRLVRQFNRSARSAQPICSQIGELMVQLPGVGALGLEDRLRLRNVADHMTRLLETTQLLESQMGTLMDVHWGALSARTNRQMQRLTTLATLLLPMTVWSGFFGMNFETMPFKEPWFFGLGMTTLVATWVGVLVYLSRRGVFTKEKPARQRPLFPRM